MNNRLALLAVFLLFSSKSLAGPVQVDQYWEGFGYSYSYYANNYASVTATYDDSSLTGIGEEFIALDSITFDISGDEAWAQGIRTYNSPSLFTARYLDGVYSALWGYTTFGVTTLGYGGTFGGQLTTSILYHGTQWWSIVSDTGPFALSSSSVPEPTGGVLLAMGVAILFRRFNRVRRINNQESR